MYHFLGKMDKFHFFVASLPKNVFWGWNFKNLSVDLESAPPRYHVCQFSGKTDNFEFFHLNLGKLPNYMWYTASNNVESVAKNSVEAETSWVEVDARFSNTLKFINYTSRATLWQRNSLVAEVTFKNCSNSVVAALEAVSLV